MRKVTALLFAVSLVLASCLVSIKYDKFRTFENGA